MALSSSLQSIGQSVAFELLLGAYHDLTPIFEITVDLPDGASLCGDKGYNYSVGEVFLASKGIYLISIRRSNMRPHDLADEFDLRTYRKDIEAANSQLESMGLQRFRARTNAGFEIMVHGSFIALGIHGRKQISNQGEVPT